MLRKLQRLLAGPLQFKKVRQLRKINLTDFFWKKNLKFSKTAQVQPRPHY
jgi:hypothetical protein